MGFHSPLVLQFETLSLLLIIIFMCTLSSVVPATRNIDTDQEALMSFKSSVRFDPPNPLSTWTQTSSPCNWTGVVCNKLGQRVIGLHLPGFALSGSISPHIGNLSFLRSLELQNNHFRGQIPNEITNLFSLKFLNMSFNFIQGVVPSNISQMKSLKTLDLMSNHITGKVLEQLSHQGLTKLQVLNLGKNSFHGEVPKSIANFSSLSTLNLGTNSFKGAIPNDIGHLRNLRELHISVNNFTGPLPPSIYNLTSLVNLAIASNNLSGEISHDIGLKLPNLVIFNFCFNKFTGKVPGSLHNLTKIQILRMSYNFLGGTVPPGLGNLPFLKTYNLVSNSIVSFGDDGLSFLSSLTNSSQLTYLAIGYNLFVGVIPESIGNLSKVLLKLYMGGNHIYGKIPISIGRLKSLSLLDLSSNSLSGEIPPQIGELHELQDLGLGMNRLSGVIPSALGNLQKLNHINLSGNSLSDHIPSSFGGFRFLLSMDLSNNRLNGSIPKESLLNLPSLSTVLNLSNNFLSGSLPKEIGVLEKVVKIDLSNNLLSGDVPISIQNCKSLEALFMANNRLSGPIPKALAKLKGLELLDLSSNQLSGSIPDELQNLQVLKYLNLSFNNLKGVVPKGGVFNNTSSVHLEGNKKLCLHLGCQNVGAKNRRMLKVIIIAVFSSTLSLCLIIGIILLHFRKSRAKVTQAFDQPLKENHQMVSYEELRRTTGNFSLENMVGNGSFGSVYKGYLQLQNITVAVKVLKNGSWKSFAAECEALRNVRHRNLVRLVTSCSSIDFKNQDFLALVYEYLSNGSLDDWIRGKRRKHNGSALNIVERLNVTIDVACALDYLHHDCVVPVVHCDIKPSNILLDEDLTAKVGDFGLARLLMMEKRDIQTSISSTHALNGSIGYIPAEYGLGEKPSTAGDAYSFGVMLLEIFTGKSPTSESFTEELNLSQWVQSAFPEKLVQIIDAQLGVDLHHQGQHVSRNLQYDCLTTVIEIGLSCTTNSPDRRMTMRNALHNLKAAKDNLLKHTIPGTRC